MTSQGSVPSAIPTSRSGRLGYVPALDGLRALAVGAVFLHHAELLDGGFLGVDVFFVISGVLITALAIGEIEDTGRLGLGGFWARRARRLLPALFALCAAVTVWSALTAEEAGREVAATLLYIANWDRLREGYEYFAAYDQPSLLEHTWSLAIEEQFYAIWPLVIAAVATGARRAGVPLRAPLATVAAIIAVGSVAWSWWSASGGTALNRLYFGTDTRAVGLALGCVAACGLGRGTQTGARASGRATEALAVAGTAVLVLLVASTDGRERWLYQWGFSLAALASLAVIVGALGSGATARLLSLRPMVMIGKVSYGVYLWHWPVIVVLDTERTGLSGALLFLLWVAITAALTATSWILIERRAPLPTRAAPRRALAYVGVTVAVGLAANVTLLPLGKIDNDVVSSPTSLTTSSVPPPTTTAGDIAGAEDSPTTSSVVPTRPLRLLLLGDSIAESMGEPTAVPLAIGPVEVEVTNRSVIACPVTFEGDWLFDDGRLIGDPPACDFDDRFAADVEEVDPDVIFLLFGWAGGIAGRQLPDGQIVAACDIEFDERYRAAFERLVDRMSQEATTVVATLPGAGYRDRPTCMNDAILTLNVATYDFGEWACPAGDCSQTATLRRDPVHFASTPEVREIIWPAIIGGVVDAVGIDAALALTAQG